MRKSRRASENFSILAHEPYHNATAQSKKIAHLESRHEEESGANRDGLRA